MGPDQTAPRGSSLIRVHIVCFHEKETGLMCRRREKQNTFQEKNNSGGIRVTVSRRTVVVFVHHIMGVGEVRIPDSEEFP